MIFKILSLTCITINLSSCAVKTYLVSEKNAFKATKYDISLDSTELMDCSALEQQKWLSISDRIINTSDSLVYTNDSIKIEREYFAVNDSIIIEYFCYTPKKFEQTIVFFIGNQSRQTSYLGNLTQLAIETNSKVFSWNYRGYGNSTGISSFKTQFLDNQYIFEQLPCKENDKPILVIGYSLGTVFATEIGTRNSVEKLILLAPFSDIPDMLINYKRHYLSGLKILLRPFIDLKPKEDYVLDISNTEGIKTFKNDLLIVHAKDDKELPYKMGKKLFELSISGNKKLESPKKGGHGASFEDKNWNIAINWIKVE